MFSGWFSKKNTGAGKGKIEQREVQSFSFLQADFHSHLIPGIDDGSPDMETSIRMLRSFEQLGYKRVITTPHVMIDFYLNTREGILNSFEKLKTTAVESGINLELGVAAEYFIDEYFSKKIDSGELLPIKDKEVLVEFSMFSEPPMLKDVLFKMVTRGYKPIIAHPERYSFLHNDYSRFADFKDRGCLLQLNLLSVTGYYGANVKKIADKLLADGLYDYCGSDAHHEKHLEGLNHLLQSKYIMPLVNYPFLNKTLCLQ